MMGDRDFRTIIKNSLDSIGKELDIEIDAKIFKKFIFKKLPVSKTFLL